MTRPDPTRRDLARWLMFAAMGSARSAKLLAIPPVASGSGYDGIRKRIQNAIDHGNATGVAVAVVRGGRIVWEEGFGWANREAGLRVSPHTPFGMASITKPFTATTLMTLVASRKVSLDEPANPYLPAAAAITGTNGDPAAVTVRMLGAHNSGLPGMYESYDADESKLAPSPPELLQRYGRLAFPPGSLYEYSNIGYAALQAIAYRATQMEFGALMRTAVLAPLGLRDSFFGSEVHRLPEGATRYDPHGRAIPHYTTSTPASGELYSSAHDLAQFALFNMKRNMPGMSSMLTAQEIDDLHRPVFTGPSGIASTFGWFTGQTASGVRFIFKTGGDPGVANRMCFVPSKGLACIVLTNQSKSADLAYGVCDEVMSMELPDWHRPDEYCGFPSTPFIATAAFRGQWEGWLDNDGAHTPVRLTIQDDRNATFAVGTGPAQPVTQMHAEGESFTGSSTATIDSPDARRSDAHALQIKLISRDDRLLGRVFANAGDPAIKNARLPYVFTLRRA